MADSVAAAGGRVSPVLGLIAAAMIVVTALAAVALAAPDLPQFVGFQLVHAGLYVAALVLVLRRPARGLDLMLILCVAAVLRAIAMQAPPNLTTDGLRYVWDGRIQWAGFNPYLHAPADAVLAHLRDAAIYPGIYLKEMAVTIYPPFAEMLFALANAVSDSLRGIKALAAAAEAVTVLALLGWLKALGLPRERVAIYALHPLPMWELSAMAHIDAAAIAVTMLAILAVARQRQGIAGGLMAAAFATKYFPLVLVPALWRRGGWSMPLAFAGVVAVLYLPYAWGAGWGVLGFLSSHLDNEGYAAGYGFHIIWILRDFGLPAPSGRVYVALALMPLAALGLWALLARRPDEVRSAHLVVLAAAFVLATSPHYAWYCAWLVPLLAGFLSPAVLGLTLLALLQNLPGNDTWATLTNLYLVVFGGFTAMAAAEVWWRRRRHGIASGGSES